MTCYSGADFARSFRTVRKNTLQIAQDIPEDSYTFRATPETRTIAETLAHIAAATRAPQRIHGDDRKAFMAFEDFAKHGQETAAYEATLRTKADILAALQENGDRFATWLEGLSDAMLAESISFPPPVEPSKKTRFEMLLGAKEHEMHHRAQLMVMERMIGIVPHLTRARQARAASQAAAGAR